MSQKSLLPDNNPKMNSDNTYNNMAKSKYSTIAITNLLTITVYYNHT